MVCFDVMLRVVWFAGLLLSNYFKFSSSLARNSKDFSVYSDSYQKSRYLQVSVLPLAVTVFLEAGVREDLPSQSTKCGSPNRVWCVADTRNTQWLQALRVADNLLRCLTLFNEWMNSSSNAPVVRACDKTCGGCCVRGVCVVHACMRTCARVLGGVTVLPASNIVWRCREVSYRYLACFSTVLMIAFCCSFVTILSIISPSPLTHLHLPLFSS